MPSWDPVIVLGCTFLAVSLGTWLAFRAIWSIDRRVHDRLTGLSGQNPANLYVRPTRAASRGPVPSRLAKWAVRLLPNDEREWSQLQTRLMHAGIYSPWAPGLFLSLKLGLIAVPPLVGLFLGILGAFNPYRGLFYGAILGGVGIVLPNVWIGRRIAKRHAVLLRSLPDFLDLMVTCVQSGLSLNGALQRVTDELKVAHPILGAEMGVVQRQIELGAPPDLALRNFAERTDLPALHALSMLVEQARRFGTSISEALRTHADTLRWQREQQAEEQAQKASVKILMPTFICIFPAIFVVLVGPAAIQIAEKLSPTSAVTQNR